MMDAGIFKRGGEEGIALITVLVVLMALVIIATPFSISMRNQSETAHHLLHRARAARECEGLRNVALETLKETHPANDRLTPHRDDPAEWEVRLDELPLDFETSDPRGKIWSLDVEDLQGRINLNGVSVYLIANLLNQRTRIMEEMTPEDQSLKVADTEGFPDAGIIWIEGEALLYASRTDEEFQDLDREFELLTLESREETTLHDKGAEVIGYPAFLIATYCYKRSPGWISTFTTKEAVRNIAVYGEAGLARKELDRIEERVTVHSGYPKGRRFVNPQRILKFGEEETADTLLVENGRYMGPGSIVRVRSGEEGEVHYSLVVTARRLGDGSWMLILQEPVPFGAASDAGIVDVLARCAVNINTASVEVVEALIEGLSLTKEGRAWVNPFKTAGVTEGGGGGGGDGTLMSRLLQIAGSAGGMGRIQPGAARKVAEAVKERPVEHFADLNERLIELAEGDVPVITHEQRWAILLNALNANDAFVHGGTAPFAFDTEGVFEINTAVSNNFAGSGREKARQFMRDLVRVAPSSALIHLFATQRDFEAQRRLTREGRHYLTLPNNLNRPDGNNLPSSRALSLAAGNLTPSEDLDASGLQLAPERVPGERCLHFDELDGPYFNTGAVKVLPFPKGDPLEAVSEYSLGFLTGERILYCEPSGHPVSILGGPYARIWPFSVEMWYRFDDPGVEHFIFDTGIEGREENNRIYLYYDGKELVFRVADTSLPTSTLNSDDPIEHAEIRYDFNDLPLEPGVFYHIACMAAGTKPSDMSLFIDGVPRGKRAFHTRLTANLDSASGQGGGPAVTSIKETVEVEDATSFPHRGVLKVGQEIIEYLSRGDKEFIADLMSRDPFGGRARRGSRANDHPETESVELYGYTCPLRSDVIPTGDFDLGDNLGRFWVAMVDPQGSNLNIQPISVKPENASYSEVTIGEGFYSSDTDTLPLKDMDGSPMGQEGMNAFSTNGGYAVVFTELPSDITVTFKGPGGTVVTRTYGPENGDGDRRTSGTPNADHYLNGFSVIRYGAYTGSTLTGVVWGESGGHPNGKPKAFMKEASDEFQNASGSGGGGRGGSGAKFNFLAKRCFITKYLKGYLSATEIEEVRVFVFPISVSLGTSSIDVFEEYYSYQYTPDRDLSEFVQISLDFNGTRNNETEWIRYDSIDGDAFCRENQKWVELAYNVLSPEKQLDVLQNIDPLNVSDAVNREINFRAQHGTPHSYHGTGSKVLPVFQVHHSSVSRPGRHDALTLVSSDPDTEPEPAQINYCNCYGSAAYNDEELNAVALIGLRSGVAGDYPRVDYDMSEVRKNVADGTATGADLALAYGIESRDLTRVVKFPSGELPNKIPDVFVLGGSILGLPSPGRGCMDEVRFKSFETPTKSEHELPRIARFVLGQELEEDEKGDLRLLHNALRYNRHIIHNPLLEPFEILKSLPQDAGLLQIGDEIIAYTDVDWEEGIILIAPEGRGVFGTEPGHHGIWEPVHLLNFPTLSILENALSDDDPIVHIRDPEGFPFGGVVLIEQELIGYTRIDDGLLTMPEEVGSGYWSRGLLRGRYGTEPGRHPSGALVFGLPIRYPDLYTPGADIPEQAYFPLSLAAPGAYFGRITWKEESPGPAASLKVQAKLGGRGTWTQSPEDSRDIYFFEQKVGPGKVNAMNRQGDRLDLRVFTQYAPGAFDPVDFASNGWKYAPVLRRMGVEYIQPTRVLRHEEWR